MAPLTLSLGPECGQGFGMYFGFCRHAPFRLRIVNLASNDQGFPAHFGLLVEKPRNLIPDWIAALTATRTLGAYVVTQPLGVRK